MAQSDMVLVDGAVLPEALLKALAAKRLLQSGEEQSVSLACARTGISRSAYYKYKDHVFDYNDTSGRIVTVYAVLEDKAGILSRLMSVLYENGANILTVNQNIPSGGRAAVTVGFRVGQLKITVAELIARLNRLDGVKSIAQISGE